MKRVISVYLPTWPTDRLRLVSNRPARDQPFATILHEGGRRVIASVDINARKLKLCPGLSVAYARALVPDLLTEDANFCGDENGLRKLAYKFLQEYSPLVALSASHNIWIDVTGCAHLFGGEENLLRALLEHLQQRHIRAKAAVADTAGAAYALARWGKGPFVIVAPHLQQEALKDLPLAGLRLSYKKIEGLRKLGFFRIGQLYATPRAPLVKRFGSELMQRLDQCLGKCDEPLDFIDVPSMPQVFASFADPLSNPEYIENVIAQLSSRLCLQLKDLNRGARKLDLVFHRVDNTQQALRVGTVSASHDEKHYMRLFKEHLSKISYGFGIEKLTLRAPLTEVIQASQLINALGALPAPDLSGLIDILNNRLGSRHVYQPSFIESDVPERSVVRRAVLGAQLKPYISPSFPRPTRILSRPEKVETMGLLPDHPPVQFIWRHKRYRIKRADGPERIFGEWWRDSAELLAVRDYFQVEDEKGERFWLFRRGDGMDPKTGSHEWFLHGFFG